MKFGGKFFTSVGKNGGLRTNRLSWSIFDKLILKLILSRQKKRQRISNRNIDGSDKKESENWCTYF